MQRLLNEPDVQAAIQAGDPAGLEEMLRRRRRFEPNPHVCRKLDELLENRRLFVRPIGRAPAMATFNGIGTMLYGRRDFDPADGAHFATLWFTLLFIPLIPLRQYLVRDVGGGSYEFLGMVPMSRGPRQMRQIVVALLVAAVAGLIVKTWYSSTRADVHFLNGLDSAVTIAAGDDVFQVEPDSRIVRRFALGVRMVRVTSPQGELLEEQELAIAGGRDLIVYNVLGAAPLIVETITYLSNPAAKLDEGEPDFKHFIGQRIVRQDKVDYPFRDPPETINLPANASVKRRKHAFVVPGGWRVSLNLLLSLDDQHGIVALMEPVAQAASADATTVLLAWSLISSMQGSEQGMHFIERLVERSPDSVEAHRVRQEAMRRMGQRDKALEIYRRMAADQPDSPTACYLRARLEPFRKSHDLFRDLASRFPDDYYAVNGYAHSLAMSRRFADAVSFFERARQLRNKSVLFSWDVYLASLVAAGRTDDAIARLVEECRREPEAVSLGTAVLYGQLAQLLPGASSPYPADHYLQSLETDPDQVDAVRAWFDLRVYGKVAPRLLNRLTDEGSRETIVLSVAAMHNPDRALSLANAATPETLGSIDDATLVLLACEAGRLGRNDLARKLLDGVSRRGPEEADALSRFALEGVESDSLAELELGVQASLHHARARRAQAAGESADQHFANARADDALHTAATRACDNWPAARPVAGEP